MAEYIEDLIEIQWRGIQDTCEGELTKRGSEVGLKDICKWQQVDLIEHNIQTADLHKV